MLFPRPLFHLHFYPYQNPKKTSVKRPKSLYSRRSQRRKIFVIVYCTEPTTRSFHESERFFSEETFFHDDIMLLLHWKAVPLFPPPLPGLGSCPCCCSRLSFPSVSFFFLTLIRCQVRKNARGEGGSQEGNEVSNKQFYLPSIPF